jgi:hypothetical protein
MTRRSGKDQVNIENKSLQPRSQSSRSDHPEDDRADERKRGKGHQNVKSVDEVHGNAPGSTSPALTERKPNRSPILKKSGTLIYPRPSSWGRLTTRHRGFGCSLQLWLSRVVKIE